MHIVRFPSIYLIFIFFLSACGSDGSSNFGTRPNSNADLSALLVADAILSPAFTSSTTSYNASVTGGITETRVTASTASNRAQLTINGVATASGAASDPIPLVIGDTDVTIVVTAEDGTQQTYAVRVRRPEPGTDARLESLTLSAGPLLQPFDPLVLGYDAGFGYLATTTRVSATPADLLADSLTVNGEDVRFGAPSNPVPLAVGIDASTLRVQVTAENDVNTRTYEVAVSRAEFSTLAQTAYVKATNTDDGDRFGSSVALAGDRLLVSAPEEQSLAAGVDGNQADNSGNAVGAAYLYERLAGVWSPAHYLKAANADNGDRFGASTASQTDLIAIGAPGEQSLTDDPADNSGNAVGAAYLFDPDLAGAPAQTDYLKADNAGDQDQFGTAIAANGNRVLVGAPFEASSASGVNGDGSDNSLTNAGAAYLFEADEAGDFVQTAYLKASNPASGTDNQFGNAVALSGETLAIAAWQESGGSPGINGNQSDTSVTRSGAVYVFDLSNVGWAQTAYIKASNPGRNHVFGSALAIDGNTLAVGAPGESTGAVSSGAVYVFTRDANGFWVQEAFLKASVVGFNDGFGSQVQLVGNLLAIGAPGERSDARGINGSDSNENAVDSGATYLFERVAGAWTQIAYLKASNTDPGDGFGSALALAGDTLAVGAPAEQSAATGVDGNQADNTRNSAGAAYVIE